MPLESTPTEIPGVTLISSRLFRDGRGYFTEVYSQRDWNAINIPAAFVQDNLSCSARGTVRGLHYQLEPHAMGKFVRVLRGSAFDVAVDLRKGSPTFGKWVGRELTGKDGTGMWIPAGFAHGFLALEDDTLLLYKCTAAWNPAAERSLAYNDPEVGVVWPMAPTNISDKDTEAPPLKSAQYNFEYRG